MLIFWLVIVLFSNELFILMLGVSDFILVFYWETPIIFHAVFEAIHKLSSVQ